MSMLQDCNFQYLTAVLNWSQTLGYHFRLAKIQESLYAVIDQCISTLSTLSV